MAASAKTKARLKALRKKHGLGEFKKAKKRKTTSKKKKKKSRSRSHSAPSWKGPAMFTAFPAGPSFPSAEIPPTLPLQTSVHADVDMANLPSMTTSDVLVGTEAVPGGIVQYWATMGNKQNQYKVFIAT